MDHLNSHAAEVRHELSRLERAARNITNEIEQPPAPHPTVGRPGPRQVADVQMCASLSLWLCLYYKEHAR